MIITDKNIKLVAEKLKNAPFHHIFDNVIDVVELGDDCRLIKYKSYGTIHAKAYVGSRSVGSFDRDWFDLSVEDMANDIGSGFGSLISEETVKYVRESIRYISSRMNDLRNGTDGIMFDHVILKFSRISNVDLGIFKIFNNSAPGDEEVFSMPVACTENLEDDEFEEYIINILRAQLSTIYYNRILSGEIKFELK